MQLETLAVASAKDLLIFGLDDREQQLGTPFFSYLRFHHRLSVCATYVFNAICPGWKIHGRLSRALPVPIPSQHESHNLGPYKQHHYAY